MSPKFGEHLRTGIEIIDNQHRDFLRNLEDLFIACKERRSKEEIRRVITFLEDYIQVHFNTEETYMIEHAYPDYADHKARHAEFNGKVRGIRERFDEEGATDNLTIYVNRTVEAWFLDHINKLDVKMATFLKDRMENR